MELSGPYEPKLVEDRIYKLWEDSGFFNPDKLPKRHKKPYAIVIPPPNITGELHIGHALNATIQDIWKWKKENENIILNQFKKLGASCDWSRTRFTMDKGYENAVKEAFLQYYKKGWIYQGQRVINWCPRCATSLSDLELEYAEQIGKLWYIKYPIKGGGSITVATTRPETMLGDTAVAVKPKDEKYKNFVGKIAILPIVSREIPIIADELVDKTFGTGA